MPDWLWFLIGPGGLLSVGFGAWRYHRKCQTIEKAIGSGNAEVVDATGRALAPVAGAARDVRARHRQRKVAEQPVAHPVVEMPRQAIAPSDDASPPVHTGRTAT